MVSRRRKGAAVPRGGRDDNLHAGAELKRSERVRSARDVERGERQSCRWMDRIYRMERSAEGAARTSDDAPLAPNRKSQKVPTDQIIEVGP